MGNAPQMSRSAAWPAYVSAVASASGCSQTTEFERRMRNCIILGAGRSGTSMLAGVMHGSGYFTGETLLKPTPSNPKGYFESEEINTLNDELISTVIPVRPRRPRGYLYPWRLPSGLLWLADIDLNVELQPNPEQATRIRRLLSRTPFCLKDPRFCYTLEAWRPALEDVVYLCVFREPGRTALSMKQNIREESYRGFHLTRARALRVWSSMYRHVLASRRDDERWVFVHYEQILDGSAIARIESATGARVSTEFIDRSLKRSPDDPDHLPPATRQVYEQLCELAGAC